MKKYLLLFLMCVYASIGAWAATTVDIRTSDGTTTITITGDGTGDVTFANDCESLPGTAVNIVVTGPLTQAVWTEIMDKKGGWNTQAANGQVIDLKGVTGLTTSELLNVGMFGNINGTNNTNYIILPTDSDVPTALQTKSNTSPSFDNWDALKYFIIPQTDGSCKVVIVDLDGQSSSDYTTSIISHLVLGTGIKKVEVLAITNDDQNPATIANKEAVETELVKAGYELKQAALTVDGCAVTVNMNGAEAGQTLADLIAAARTAVIAGGQTGICTLTVTGPVTNNDLIALGGTNMTGATRIDLSNATLGSGVTVENIQLPTSLTSLILPKGLTVSVGLKSKLTAATNLKYAYSPSTGTTGVSPDTETISVADYVWVNSTGGLDLALTNESTLNESKYVKVASDVALSETDITFNKTGRLPNVKYFDMRNANMDASLAAESFKSPNSTDYRIILPDNWTTEQMSAFASHLGDVFWTMAAIYSYSGTTLKIYEATDTKYMPTALSNHRIVVDGTTAIEVVGSTLGTKLLTALNGADSDVKTITISAIINPINGLTFDNDNITTLNVTGVINNNNAQLNVDGCAALKTLNVTGSAISSVDASATSLEAVNLNGSTISNNVDLSDSGLKTLTTNSNTWIQGDLHLESTASFTSFASTAKFGVNNATNGNIYLNASGVSTVDLQSVQFQNTSSNIHIDSTVDEGDTPLTKLNADGQLTIYIPTGFTRNRLHPYSSATLDDNIAELAATGAFEDDCNPKCRIEYNAETHVATVHCYTPGHFKALMEKDNNYGKFVDGAIFTFAADCKLNAEDLAALAGKDGYGNFNWNYVDLYNLPASYDNGGTTVNYETVITDAINILRTENWQYKGLLLPKTVQNVGTTLIMDSEAGETKLATCSESIAYSGSLGTSALTAAYIYKAADDWGISYEERLAKMKVVMNLHPEITNNTTHWSISTNSPTEISMSVLPDKVTINSTEVNTSKLQTINNDMVTANTNKVSILAYPATEKVMKDVVDKTGIGNTPNLDILKITGPVNADDIKSINKFTKGPRVFDLSDATGGITKAMLESITNANIEYIILPAGMTKEDVCEAAYTSGLKTKLKAVISSSNTNLVAYVNKAGSLAEARYLATGGSIDEGTKFITPAQTGLQSVTLAGSLNAADIAANTTTHHVDASGHWVSGGANATSIALSGEQGTITTIDLKDAVFEEYTPTGGKLTSDMNFSYAGLGSIQNITLPTSKDMTLIPEECFMGITSFNDLCIPYNYKKIDNKALYGTYCGHITTTDANGAVIDNGARTYTLSKNLEEIGTKPAEPDDNGVYSLSETVFPQNRGVKDVYVLAHKVPKCYANAFPANMLYGWGGFKGSGFPYCREKYDNSADGSLIFTVLHFPDETSFNASSDKESSYELMKKLYTDVNKIYTKKEQTGAVDANGDEITWPTFSELRRTYNQATNGMTWNDWETKYDTNEEVNGGDQIPTTSQPAGSRTGDYDFPGYEGWHQFTLALATYVEPDEKVEEEKIIREYVDAGWFTICIPFDMTIKQAREWLGVPQSAGNVICKYNNEEIDSPSKTKMPDIRQLTSVIRHTSSGGSDNNKVTFRLTGNLYNDGTPYYLDFDLTAAKGKRFSPKDAGNESSSDIDEKVCLRGGIPYIIKAYKRKGEKISGYNIGQYIMTHYSDEFKEKASCVNHGSEYYEYLGNPSDVDKLATLKFAKPYEEHQIVAMNDAESASYLDYYDNGTPREYRYALVGQFWTQKLPKYCFYQSKGVWYRNTSDSYNWSAYKCVIMAVPTLTSPNITGHMHANCNFRSNPSAIGAKEEGKSFYPSIEEGSTDKLNGTLKIVFADGRDDDDFAASAKYIFAFDDGIVEYDETGNEATAIDKLDGVDVTPLPDNYKVYNINGQYVGDSLEGLGKGLYIVNGKKYIVR